MTSRRILVLNTGSSSLKWVVLDAASEAVVEQGDAAWHDPDPGRHADELHAALRKVPDVDAVGHRVVHGGTEFHEAAIIDDTIRSRIAELATLAPLHNPAAVAGIDAARGRFPHIPHVAAFDTAFHATLDARARTYALPREWTVQWGLRRFGFHGLSVEYAAGRAAELLGGPVDRLIVCHLGAGCSVTAVHAGRSFDTSMGFTPLEGVMMARRSGSIDAGLVLHLLRYMDPAELDSGLNERSGVLGVSGVSSDMREVLAAVAEGNLQARLAVDMFTYRVATCVGGMIAALAGVDAVVFTGGIGEHSDVIRRAICEPLGFVGLKLADETSSSAVDRDIATPESRVRVLVIAAREDLSVMRQTVSVLDANQPTGKL